ncbi:hypothetical protein CANARDRAFT_6314 [[Candida] arabinofermentans NRRL YB-2248]|uniref:Uncharacterized protein n=1 Tax=[Candida] arabinofermentans NRRL YB-2248 TaxID=983967 RepID=A0A1E4T4U3_9ASCO|nr:hypothetical protein CANARDRAFT_6314 [[Candida] arabinofermentans NRRL YB-2248]
MSDIHTLSDTEELSSIESVQDIYQSRSKKNWLSNGTHLVPLRSMIPTKIITAPTMKVNFLVSTVSRGIQSLGHQVRDDNPQTRIEVCELRNTRLGRMKGNLDISESIRVMSLVLDNQQQNTSSSIRSSTIKTVEYEESIIAEIYDESGLPPRDKGYAWIIVLGEFLLLFATWGCNGAYGVFLSYWMKNGTFKNTTTTDYALVGSLVLDSVTVQIIPSAWCYENLMVGIFALFAEVASLKLKGLTLDRPFIKAQVKSGCFGLGRFCFIVLLREWKVRQVVKTRVSKAEEILGQTASGLGADNGDMLNKRRLAYTKLLEGGPFGFIRRMLYPIKV